ncbi:MAG: outer membrane protein assembly factor BamB [Woeseiaceae bacterium]|nr:outer membrane protein assembly factor BamB [Woeseiaceae bacterium]
MTLIRNIAVLLLAALALAGCGIFKDKVEEDEKPAKLTKFEPTLKVRRAWSTKLGDESEFLRLALRPAGDGNWIYAASPDGRIRAIDASNGREQWQKKLGLELVAGPGVGDGTVVVVASDGQVIALDARDGGELWRNEEGVESLSQPVVAEDHVFVQSVDNQLRALQIFDGRERWSVSQTQPVLTMRGTSTPIVVGNDVVAGFDNGRLVSVNIDTGDIGWETLLAPPTGRSDLERLSDIDGDMAAVGQDIYAAGYQGRVSSVAAESGQTLWTADISTYEGVAADWNSIYTVQDGGVLIALVRRSGAEEWRQDSLVRREPTVPVPFNTTVVAGDFEGYLHFFSNVSGEPAARLRQGKSAITATPLVMGNRLFVQSDGGTLAAYEVIEPERPPNRAPDIADEDEGA